jgi:hypothetical protein
MTGRSEKKSIRKGYSATLQKWQTVGRPTTSLKGRIVALSSHDFLQVGVVKIAVHLRILVV